ncbi:MAG: type II toxin-antitoxin system prevent-host-death family antitoxin [Candidatus Methylumidiphilus sp.]
MNWNIAEAKRHFAEVIKQAAENPQVIYQHDQAVAAVVGAAEFAEFDAWRQLHGLAPKLDEVFAELRALADGDDNPLPDPERSGRSNAFVEMLEQEGEADVSG